MPLPADDGEQVGITCSQLPVQSIPHQNQDAKSTLLSALDGVTIMPSLSSLKIVCFPPPWLAYTGIVAGFAAEGQVALRRRGIRGWCGGPLPCHQATSHLDMIPFSSALWSKPPVLLRRSQSIPRNRETRASTFLLQHQVSYTHTTEGLTVDIFVRPPQPHRAKRRCSDSRLVTEVGPP